MAKTPEAEVRDPVVAFAREIGAEHRRNVLRPGQPVGWPDDTFYLPYVVLDVEFKAQGKKPNRKQEDRIARLRDLNCLVLVIDNVEEGKMALGVCRDLEELAYMHAAPSRSCALEKYVADKCGRPYRGLVAACRKIEV